MASRYLKTGYVLAKKPGRIRKAARRIGSEVAAAGRLGKAIGQSARINYRFCKSRS